MLKALAPVCRKNESKKEDWQKNCGAAYTPITKEYERL
jgi:hypothetical protein